MTPQEKAEVQQMVTASIDRRLVAWFGTVIFLLFTSLGGMGKLYFMLNKALNDPYTGGMADTSENWRAIKNPGYNMVDIRKIQKEALGN